MVYKKLYDELYGVSLLFFSGCKIEYAQRKANRVFNIQEQLSYQETDAASFHVCTTLTNETVYLIWVQKNKDISKISHEVTHLVFEVFKDRGIPTNYNNQETFAYYLDSWIGKILAK